MILTVIFYTIIFWLLTKFDLYSYFVPFHSLFGNIISTIIIVKIIGLIFTIIKELQSIKYYYNTQSALRRGRYTRLVREVLLLSGNIPEQTYELYTKKKLKEIVDSSWMIMYLMTGLVYRL